MNLLLIAALGFAFGSSVNNPTQGPTLEEQASTRDRVVIASRDMGYLSAMGVMGCGDYDVTGAMDFLTSLSNFYGDNSGESLYSAGQFVFSQQAIGTSEALVFINQIGCERLNSAVVDLRYTTPYLQDVMSIYTPKG